MKSRQDYMSGKCTHDEYYAQFVNQLVREIVMRHIGLRRIKESSDPHFNDIPLNQWDAIAPNISQCQRMALREAGDGISLAGGVCIAKAAAKMLKSEAA